MPQVCAKRGRGVALDLGLTQQPAPVFLDVAKYPARDYRANIRDANNAVLNQPVIDNVLDDRHWRGKGFPGAVQFVPYVGREPLRPGVKLERDIQTSTMPLENFKPLNVTSMGSSKDKVMACRSPTAEEHAAHGEAMASMKAWRGVATQCERLDNGHAWRRDEVAHSNLRQQRLAEQSKLFPGLRAAGLASINSRLGTCGSLPDLNRLRGATGNEAWRQSTPWAMEGEC